MARKPWFSIIGSVYFNMVNKFRVSGGEYRGYAFKKYPELVSVFGCEGGRDAPIAFIDGSFLLRDGGNRIITFGVKNIESKIKWYNAEGFLPCLVSEYEKDGVKYTVKNFSDKLTVDGNIYDAAYSRITAENTTGRSVKLSPVSKYLIPLTDEPEQVQPYESVTRDYTVIADRFAGSYKLPDAECIKACGGFDEHYAAMKNYWLKRLEPLTEITEIPDRRLSDALKAGYIYTMICKDGFELHVGENGYDRVFDHDVIGILNTLLLLGDFRDVEKYSDFILKNVQYPDARWKYSWFFALYLQKTGNIDFVRSNFENIKSNALDIISSISKDGIMKETIAIDSPGHWTVDNFSALTGLICYRYICEKLGETEESAKAEEAYNTLLKNCESCLKQTIEKYGLDYIPMNMKKPNSETSRSDPRDANRLSMFLFGRWLWDGFLFGGKGSDYINGLIDSTYEHSAKVRENISDSFYNFGGYPHGYFCSAYNAGYGSAALMGSRYRDAGIKAYEFMIDCAQSGPYSWWEGIKFPKDDSPWDIDHASGGGGSCPHMWGQSTAGKVLIDSIICEKADGALIIGRGVPAEWIYEGSVIEIKKYPVSGGRVNMRAEIRDNKAYIKIEGNYSGKVQVNLPGITGYNISD